MAVMAVNGATLSPTQMRALTGPALSSTFTPDDRLYRSYEDFSKVYEWPDLDLRAMREMLSKDGNPRKLEQVLTLPLRSAPWELRGSGPALGLVRANLEPKLPALIGTSMSAVAYRKAFHETVWALDGGHVVYEAIAARPAVACEAAYRDVDGKPDGFRQQLPPITVYAQRTSNMGWVDVPQMRSFIYVYGSHREPLRGVSDLDVSLYCWENIRKLQFLWCQFLEQQSLPKVLVYGDDSTEAQRNAQNVADANASATIPIVRRTDDKQMTFEVLESSGRGADQFEKAIRYFEAVQTKSVLASFMDLAEHATNGRGSNALSADQSEFFLASRQAVADELADQVTEKVIRPLVVYNYGDVEVPRLHIGPIGNRQTDRALALLDTIVAAPAVNAPREFVGFLLNKVSSLLGLDDGDIEDAIERWGQEQPAPPRSPDLPAQQPNSQMSAAIDMAAGLVEQTQAGVDPQDALRAVTRPYGRRKRRR